MTVYIQKKINGKWRLVLPVDQERAHRVCHRLMINDLKTEIRIVENMEADQW
jgi:hypothetical protein